MWQYATTFRLFVYIHSTTCGFKRGQQLLVRVSVSFHIKPYTPWFPHGPNGNAHLHFSFLVSVRAHPYGFLRILANSHGFERERFTFPFSSFSGPDGFQRTPTNSYGDRQLRCWFPFGSHPTSPCEFLRAHAGSHANGSHFWFPFGQRHANADEFLRNQTHVHTCVSYF